MTFKIKLLFSFILVFVYQSVFGQLTDYEKGQAVGALFNLLSNSSKEVKGERLQNQTFALQALNRSLDYLDKGNYQQAYKYSEEAMLSFPKYSLPYLVMAYSAIKSGDYLNSNRMINLYTRYSKRKFNKELNSKVPKEFIEFVQEKNRNGVATLEMNSLNERFNKEPWLNSSFEVRFLPSVNIFGDGAGGVINYNANRPINDFPEFVSDNNISVVYNKYFWTGKKNGLPYTNNNLGVRLAVGVDANLQFPNSYFPTNFNLFVNPGFFLKKVYVSPGQIRYFRINDYPEAYSGSSRRNYPSFGFLFSPEVRWYPGVMNAYATDMRKLSASMKSSARFSFGYLSLRIQRDELSGSANNNRHFSMERVSYLFGFFGYAGKNRTTEFGTFLGPGSVYGLSLEKGDDNYNISGDFWRIGFTIAKRLW